MVENLDVRELSTVEGHIRILGFSRKFLDIDKADFPKVETYGTEKALNLCHPIYYTNRLDRNSMSAARGGCLSAFRCCEAQVEEQLFVYVETKLSQ